MSGELKVDATVKIGAIDQPIGALTGTGTVEMQGGRLTVGGVSTFDGKIIGKGSLRLGSGAAVTLLDGAEFKIGADTPATLIETPGKVILGGAVSLVFTDNLREGNWTLVKWVNGCKVILKRTIQ